MTSIDIRGIVIGFLAITISLTVHEFAHAFVADKLGDPTPRANGRLTLNPMVLWVNYPIGSLVAPLLGAFSGFLMGWAATPVNPHKVRRGISVRTADLLISAAGPLSNILLALLSILGVAALWTVAGAPDSVWYPLSRLMQYLVLANVFLAVFNMLPIPPLDGYRVLSSIAPQSWAPALQFLEQFGMLILLVVIFKGGVIFEPVVQATLQLMQWTVQVFHG